MTATATLRIERAEGYAKIAKTLNSTQAVVPLAFLDHCLTKLVGLMTPDWIEALSDSEAKEVKESLQNLHRTLVSLLKREPEKTVFFCAQLLSRIRDREEDLYDVIESLVLRNNPEFQALLSDCTSSLGIR